MQYFYVLAVCCGILSMGTVPDAGFLSRATLYKPRNIRASSPARKLQHVARPWHARKHSSARPGGVGRPHKEHKPSDPDIV